MARISGIDLPKNKRGIVGLTYIFGIGRGRAKEILNTAGVEENIKVQDWDDDQLSKIRTAITENFKVEGALCLISPYYLVTFFLLATVFFLPFLVLELFFVLCPRKGNPLLCLIPL